MLQLISTSNRSNPMPPAPWERYTLRRRMIEERFERKLAMLLQIELGLLANEQDH